MQLASQKPLSGQVVVWTSFLLQGLLGHFLPYWVICLTYSFTELSRNFHEMKTYLQTPAISRGHIRQKAGTRGLVVWLWQSLTFGSFAAAGLQKRMLYSVNRKAKLSNLKQNYQTCSLFTVHPYSVLFAKHSKTKIANSGKTFRRV